MSYQHQVTPWPGPNDRPFASDLSLEELTDYIAKCKGWGISTYMLEQALAERQEQET